MNLKGRGFAINASCLSSPTQTCGSQICDFVVPLVVVRLQGSDCLLSIVASFFFENSPHCAAKIVLTDLLSDPRTKAALEYVKCSIDTRCFPLNVDEALPPRIPRQVPRMLRAVHVLTFVIWLPHFRAHEKKSPAMMIGQRSLGPKTKALSTFAHTPPA